MGLDRNPAGPNLLTPSDTRWRSRKEVWDIAKLNLTKWNQAPVQPMAEVIASCALLSGHYSIWMKVFETEQMVLDEIDRFYRTKHLYKVFQANGHRAVRPNGLI
jgi:hypothetical protein